MPLIPLDIAPHIPEAGTGAVLRVERRVLFASTATDQPQHLCTLCIYNTPSCASTSIQRQGTQYTFATVKGGRRIRPRQHITSAGIWKIPPDTCNYLMTLHFLGPARDAVST